MTCKTRARSVVLAAAQWQADFQSLVAFPESTHPNLFFHASAQDFNAAVNNPARG
jgi:hypothetical protein